MLEQAGVTLLSPSRPAFKGRVFHVKHRLCAAAWASPGACLISFLRMMNGIGQHGPKDGPCFTWNNGGTAAGAGIFKQCLEVVSLPICTSHATLMARYAIAPCFT